MARAHALAPLLLAVVGACGAEEQGTASNAGGSPSTGGNVGTGGTGGAVGGGGTTSAGGSLGIGGVSGAPTLARKGETLELPTFAGAVPKRFVDVAFDPDHEVYLVVHGNSATAGAFVNGDAQPMGAPFAIADTLAWTQGSRSSFGGGTFLVSWSDGRDGAPKPRARTVRFDSTAPVLGSDFALSSSTCYQEAGPGIAYSPKSDTFLVAWHRTPGDDIVATRVSSGGQAIGAEIELSSDPDWQSDPTIAWNPDRDEFLVAYSHASASGAEIRAQRVNAATGALSGSTTSLTSAAGTWLPQLAWEATSQRYLAAWYEGKLQGRWLDADGAPTGAAFDLAPGYGAYDGFALAAHPALGAFAAVFHGTTDEDFAMSLGRGGEPGPVLQATSSPGDEGHFNPRIAANAARAEWLLVTSLGYHTVVVQRLGL